MRDCLSAQEVEPEWAAHYTHLQHGLAFGCEMLTAGICGARQLNVLTLLEILISAICHRRASARPAGEIPEH